MIDHVVVDVEIQHAIGDVVDGKPVTWDDTDKLGVACAVVYEFKTDRFRIFGPDDVVALRTRLMDAEQVSGFNIWKFDFPVIWGLPGRQRMKSMAPKTNDLLRRIWQAKGLDPDVFTSAHKGVGLDNICKSTLRAGKIGFGGDAPKWFQDGLHAKVINYCVDDVTLERDITEFADRYGFVLCDDRPIWLKQFEGA
jgi:DEAD/DEAH box helicase domain-containing protein